MKHPNHRMMVKAGGELIKHDILPLIEGVLTKRLDQYLEAAYEYAREGITLPELFITDAVVNAAVKGFEADGGFSPTDGDRDSWRIHMRAAIRAAFKTAEAASKPKSDVEIEDEQSAARWSSVVNRKTGPIDWTFDFMRLFDRLTLSAVRRQTLCEQHVNNLRAIEAAVARGEGSLSVRIREGLAIVHDTGMFKRTPKARPRPGILVTDPSGRRRWVGFTAIKIDTMRVIDHSAAPIKHQPEPTNEP